MFATKRCNCKRDLNCQCTNLFFLLLPSAQELSPTPEIFPGLSKVRVGDTVKIECRCRGQLSVIKWFKDGESVVAKSEKIKIQNYFNIRTRESTSMLSVKNIDQSDAGVYRCQASSKLHPGYSSFIDSKVEIKGIRVALLQY